MQRKGNKASGHKRPGGDSAALGRGLGIRGGGGALGVLHPTHPERPAGLGRAHGTEGVAPFLGTSRGLGLPGFLLRAGSCPQSQGGLGPPSRWDRSRKTRVGWDRVWSSRARARVHP